MNPEQDQFKDLRRLMALKRHETPPPGYFNRFSGDVIARIKAGEQAADRVGIVERLLAATGVQKAWAALQTSPMALGSVGVAACALLVFGVVGAATAPDGSVKLTGIDPSGNPMLVNLAATEGGASGSPIVKDDGFFSVSASGGDSLFEQAASSGKPQFQRVNFDAPANPFSGNQ